MVSEETKKILLAGDPNLHDELEFIQNKIVAFEAIGRSVEAFFVKPKDKSAESESDFSKDEEMSDDSESIDAYMEADNDLVFKSNFRGNLD